MRYLIASVGTFVALASLSPGVSRLQVHQAPQIFPPTFLIRSLRGKPRHAAWLSRWERSLFSPVPPRVHRIKIFRAPQEPPKFFFSHSRCTAAFASNLDALSECLGECLRCSPLSCASVTLTVSTFGPKPSARVCLPPRIDTGKEVSVHVTF